MSFRNRCIVAGSNGLINLSVPLENGRNQRRPTKDVRVSNHTNWQLQQWRTIESCYNRSPFFEFYRDWLQQFFEKRFVFLTDMNMEILEWTKKQLKLKTGISVTEIYNREQPENVLDLRDHFRPQNYRSVTAGPEITYTQVFADRIGFQPNLSILDLLFCTGPEAQFLLQGNKSSF